MARTSPKLLDEACGFTPPLVLDVKCQTTSRRTRWSLRQPFVLVGSLPQCDLPLEHPDISYRHAFLQVLEGRVHLLDLGSRTGVHGVKPATAGPILDPGQSIRIGPFVLRLVSTGSPSAATSTEPPSLVEQPQPSEAPTLQITIQHQATTIHWTMNRSVALLGRSARSHVRLRDNSVSRVHAALVRTPVGVWIIDLAGRGGIRVNGEALRFALLEHGDEFQVGTFSIQCALPGSSQPTLLVSPPPAPLPVLPTINSTLIPYAALPERVEDRTRLVETLVSSLLAQYGQMQQQMYGHFEHVLVGVLQMVGLWQSDQIEAFRRELRELGAVTQELRTRNLELKSRETLDVAQLVAQEEVQVPGPLPALSEPAVPTPPDAPSAPVPPLPPAPSGFEGPPEEIHSWLNQRIANLEEQQQSRLQQFLSSLFGRTARQGS